MNDRKHGSEPGWLPDDDLTREWQQLIVESREREDRRGLGMTLTGFVVTLIGPHARCAVVTRVYHSREAAEAAAAETDPHVGYHVREIELWLEAVNNQLKFQEFRWMD